MVIADGCTAGRDSEYPWPRAAPHTAPVEYTFGIWHDLRNTPAGNQFIKLIASLFAAAEAFL
jgi:hypothetical protein